MEHRRRNYSPKSALFKLRHSKYLCLLILIASARLKPLAQIPSADEQEIRAAMIFNLTKFVDWPAWKLDQAHPEFVICLLGSDPLAVDLENVLRNKQVGNKPVVLRRINSVSAASSCHILYIGISEHRNLAGAANELARNSVLSMSDKSNSENQTQVIGLPTSDEHVRIDVNISAAQRSGLTLSSKLLRLARVTH